MSDLIDREKFIYTLIFSEKTKSILVKDLRSVIEVANEMPSAEPERKWIPVTERLPEDERIVLCTVKGYKDARWVFTDCRYKNDTWEYLDEPNYDYWTKLDDVLAWMPLPEPYGGDR